MPVIAFANSKGGSGKTTSALLLGCSLARSWPTTIIDADPRHPIAAWEKLAPIPPNLTIVINESERTILDEIEVAAETDPFVLIDLEGTASRLMSYAISQADLVIIPIKEQQQDAAAALDVISEIHRDMKAMKRNIPYIVLITQSKAAVKSRTARHIAAQFRENTSIDVFSTELHEREAFSAIFSIGGAIEHFDPQIVRGTDKALQNIAELQAEMLMLLKKTKENTNG